MALSTTLRLHPLIVPRKTDPAFDLAQILSAVYFSTIFFIEALAGASGMLLTKSC